MIFPFADVQLEKVKAEVEQNGARHGGNYLGAARNFLNMLLRLQTIIILQDAAAMHVEHPARCNGHMLFLAFPEIFRSQLFIDYTEQMRRGLADFQEVENAAVDTVLPGVLSNLNSLEHAIRQNDAHRRENMKEMEGRIRDDIKESVPDLIRNTMLTTWQGLLSGMLSGMTEAFGGMPQAAGTAAATTAMANIARAAAAATTTTTTTQQQTSSEPWMEDKIRNFRFESHRSLQGIWDEWYGLGAFVGRPIVGGVAELERLYGAKCRPKSAIQQRASQHDRNCQGMKKKAEQENKTIQEVCLELDKDCIEKFNRNTRTFVGSLGGKFLPQTRKRKRRSNP